MKLIKPSLKNILHNFHLDYITECGLTVDRGKKLGYIRNVGNQTSS